MERKVYEMWIDENDPESGITKLSMVADPAIESGWVALSEAKRPLKLKTLSEEKRLVTGPALIPNIQIKRFDEKTNEEYFITFPEKTIELASQLYMKRLYNNNVNIEHSQDVTGVSLVESWIVSDSSMDKSVSLGFDHPKGTWFVSLKISSDEIWNEYVKSGELTGISIEGSLGHREMTMSSDDDKIVNEIKSLLNDYTGESI